MISGRHITKIAVLLMAAALLVCLTALALPAEALEVLGEAKVSMEYASGLFDRDEVLHIDIRMEEEDWEEMLEHALEEAYYSCEVCINGTSYQNVGIRPKGNTSLSAIAGDPENNRYSFKLEFDRFVSGQTCQGLDKLILNNNYADATNMKEAIVYDMYRFLDADASLYNYAEISVNGSYWGIYLALEAVEESFLLRNYGVQNGGLYKPEGMGMKGDGDGGERFFGGKAGGPQIPRRSGGEDAEEAWRQRADTAKAGPGGFPMGGSRGADLNYTDDNPDSYTTIWEGVVIDGAQGSRARVVEALRHISEKEKPEKYMDVDNLLKYMAVHTFSVNQDSLSGNMAHNYYLYESEGRLNILPWDYNLAFGGMNMGGARGETAGDVVNFPIDSPFSGTDFFDVLLENEEYLERYHTLCRRLAEEYVGGGILEETFTRIRSQIDELVKTDPNAMYSYEEYEAGAQTLYELLTLRALSMLGQLDGTIPATQEGQRADSSALIDASSIDLEAMGTFMGGGFGGGREQNGLEEPAVPFPETGEGSDGLLETDSENRNRGKPFPQERMQEGYMNPPSEDAGPMDIPPDFHLSAIPTSAQAAGGRWEKIRWYAGCLFLILLLSGLVKIYPLRRRIYALPGNRPEK